MKPMERDRHFLCDLETLFFAYQTEIFTICSAALQKHADPGPSIAKGWANLWQDGSKSLKSIEPDALISCPSRGSREFPFRGGGIRQ